MINDFISSDQRDVQTQFMVIAHIQNLFIEIQNEGINIGINRIDEEDEFKQGQQDTGNDAEEREDNILRKTGGGGKGPGPGATPGEWEETPGEWEEQVDEESDEDDDDDDSDDDDDDDASDDDDTNG